MANQVPPIVESKVRDLAATPPGQEAQSKAADLLALLLALLKDQTISGLIPEKWKPWIAGLVAVLTIVAASGLFVQYNNVTKLREETTELTKQAKELSDKTDKSVKEKTVTVEKKPSWKMTPTSPKGGDLVVISTDIEEALFDFDGVFLPTQAKQVGKNLYIAMPQAGEGSIYTIQLIYVLDKKIKIEKVNITFGKPDEEAKRDTLKQLRIDTDAKFDKTLSVMAKNQSEVLAAIGRLQTNVDALTARVTALEGAKPPPQAILKHLTFVGGESTAVSKTVVNDAGLRTSLKSDGVSVHTLRKDDPFIESKGLTTAVEKAGGPPCVILQDENGSVIGTGPMKSAAEVQDLASKFIRK